MFNNLSKSFRGLRSFLILFGTQSFSTLGSAMTSFALIVWSYRQQGSALSTALLSVCTYAPYVLLSVFAGALSDRWDRKRTMLVCDTLAALSTVAVMALLAANRLQLWHLYGINALSGLMNTVQQPAGDVAITLLTPKEQYQRTSGIRSLSNSLITMLTPAIATALMAFAGIHAVLWFDLFTFAVAFVALRWLVPLPKKEHRDGAKPGVLHAGLEGIRYLKREPGILHLILFLSLINFTASIYNAALPAMLLSRQGGGEVALGAVNTVTGLATLCGSLLATALPAPKSRVRVILNTLLFSMSTENFVLALGRSTPVWCVGAALGWIVIPLMATNMDVLLRSHIPVDMQGRVYAARNTFQFFTIPIGYLLGGVLVDRVFEPLMAAQPTGSVLLAMFGSGKGSGAALLFLIIGVFGGLSCLPFRADKAIARLEKP